MERKIIPYITPFPAKGSHLLKEFANTGTPILDSLIRESIQNSLDAAIGSHPVFMHFTTGDFDKHQLFSHFSQLEDMLQTQYPDIPNHFICFRDYNTMGLTGNVVDMGDQNTGNYFKLVLDIGNEQTNAGAGGSCGIGKSLYFRIGLKGFVIYYSRIKTDAGDYESRLIAIMVENERGDDYVIPSASDGMSRTGIAYWGILDNSNILPVTNEEEIKRLLDIFHIKPYENNETGTAVILPFIDESRLLADNKKEFVVGRTSVIPFWHKSIEDFLKFSVQRWYFARLNNTKYRYGNWLSVKINEQTIDTNQMAPCFKILQALYNRAVGWKEEELKDILSNKENVCKDDVSLNRYRPLARKKSGTIAYILADKSLLGMMPPDNNYSPYIYCDTGIQDNDTNAPILGYCRKPGMIVNYETSGDWLYRVPDTNNELFLMAVFVLYSNNKLGDNSSLEEYVRKMEPNDHMEWVDGTFNGENYSFIRFTKNKVATILANYLSSDEKTESKRKVSELGKVYSWILPPEDFGKKPRPRSTQPSGGEGGGRTKGSNKKLRYSVVGQELKADSITITYCLETIQKKTAFGMKLLVSTTDGKNINLEEWEKMGAIIPFYIQSTQISLKKVDGRDCSNFYPLDSNRSAHYDPRIGLNMELSRTTGAFPFALDFKFDSSHSFKMEIKLTIHISSRKALPTINIV